jgi:hypothetical protein
MNLVHHSTRTGPPRRGPPDARLVCYAYRANADVPCAELTVDGSLGRAKVRAENLLLAHPASQFIEIFRGDNCVLRITRATLPCAA